MVMCISFIVMVMERMGRNTGRRMGDRSISMKEIEVIVDLTLSEDFVSRGEIADRVGFGKKTVYNYQRSLDLV